MLRRFHTAVLEKNETCEHGFDTEPMECGWASEATWFVRVTELTSGTEFRAQAQVSPDGLDWCDKESLVLRDRGRSPSAELVRVTDLRARGPGLYQLELRHFGGWLRLRCDLSGGDAPRVKLTIYLALKE